MKSIRDVDVVGKKVLIRVDFNVPLKDSQMGGKEVSNDGRIRAVLPTLKYLIENKAKVIVMSHLGRPDGQVIEKYSLDPAVLRLQELLGKIVINCGDCVGESVLQTVDQMKEGDVVVLGNLRFHPGEEENDENFAKELAGLGDIYVNDAFAVSHRAHASVEAVTHLLPSYAGFLMEKELETLGSLVKNPEHPFLLIMGGAKAADKIPVIRSLEDKIDAALFGGVVANSFLASGGVDLGASKLEADKLPVAKEILDELRKNNKQILLPIDLVVSSSIDGSGEITTVKVGDKFDPSWKALDIGHETIDQFIEIVHTAKTILWNGDVGMSEVSPFDQGTKMLAEAIVEATANGAKSIICGGDTTGTVTNFGLADKMTYLSTGGGAALEFLAGMELPGVKALG